MHVRNTQGRKEEVFATSENCIWCLRITLITVKVIGSGYSKGQTYRADWCFRFGEDHDGFRESSIPTKAFLRRTSAETCEMYFGGRISLRKLIDASLIESMSGSTVATMQNIHYEFRKIYAKTAMRKTGNTKRGIFPCQY